MYKKLFRLSLFSIMLLGSFNTYAAVLDLKRHTVESKSVYGHLSINGVTFDTVENNDFIIPLGTYKIYLTYSPRFKKIMPMIDVPGRDGIRIHPANTSTVLLGCIGLSTVDFKELFKLLQIDKENTIVIS